MTLPNTPTKTTVFAVAAIAACQTKLNKTTVFTLFAVLGRDRAGDVDCVPPSLPKTANSVNTVFFPVFLLSSDRGNREYRGFCRLFRQ